MLLRLLLLLTLGELPLLTVVVELLRLAFDDGLLLFSQDSERCVEARVDFLRH